MPDSYTELANGNGLNVVVLSNGREGGIKLVGDDITTERPIYIGVYGSTSIANASPLIEGQLVALKAATDGRLITLPYCNPEDVITVAPVLLANDNSEHELIPAQATGIKTAFLGGVVSTASATVVHMILKSAATELVRIPLVNAPYVFPVPFKTGVNASITYTLSTAVGANTAWFTPLAYKTKL